jgi:hypothetical protein
MVLIEHGGNVVAIVILANQADRLQRQADVHQIRQWPERGWLVEIMHSERATGGAPLNVLLTAAIMPLRSMIATPRRHTC